LTISKTSQRIFGLLKASAIVRQTMLRNNITD
jgi:hypothetical protein